MAMVASVSATKENASLESNQSKGHLVGWNSFHVLEGARGVRHQQLPQLLTAHRHLVDVS